MDADTEFRRRLRLIMQQFGSVADLAKAVGVSDNAIYKWVSGRGQPGMTSLVNLAKAAGVSVEWLATGEGSSKASSDSSDDVGFSATRGEVILPSDGTAVVYSAQVVDVLRFHTDWFTRHFGIAASDVALFEVRGDSMTPTINAGDLCLVNLLESHFTRDGLYALCNDSELGVRRLQREADGDLVILSDNSAYRPVHVKRDEITIVGRVIWRSGKL